MLPIITGLAANAPTILAAAGAVGSVAGAVDKVNKAIHSTRKTIDMAGNIQNSQGQPDAYEIMRRTQQMDGRVY